MDPVPTTVAPATPLAEAARRMLETESGCLLAVEGDRLVGIVTEHDLVREAVDRL